MPTNLPSDSAARKDVPLARGVLDYFPAALREVARVSKAGNDKHNPGQPLHHSRGKSSDHADALLRHLVDRGDVDPDTGMRHSALVAWRALALLQEELERAGEAPVARGAVFPAGDSGVPNAVKSVYEYESDINRRAQSPRQEPHPLDADTLGPFPQRRP